MSNPNCFGDVGECGVNLGIADKRRLRPLTKQLSPSGDRLRSQPTFKSEVSGGAGIGGTDLINARKETNISKTETETTDAFTDEEATENVEKIGRKLLSPDDLKAGGYEGDDDDSKNPIVMEGNT